MIHVLLVEDKNMSRETMGGYIKRSGRYELTASITNAGTADRPPMMLSIFVSFLSMARCLTSF